MSDTRRGPATPNSPPPPSLPIGPGAMRGGMMGPIQKARDFRGTFRRLVKYLHPERYRFYLVFTLAIVSTLFMIVGPKIMGNATTRLAEGVIARMAHAQKLASAVQAGASADVIAQLKAAPVPAFDMAYVVHILTIMAGLYLLSAVLNFVMSYVMSSVAQNTVFHMRNDVKQKLDRLPLRYFDERPYGDILSRVTNDMDTIANTLQQSLMQLVSSLVTVVGILIMMITISPLMTLIALVTLPASGIFTALIGKRSQKYFAAVQKDLGQLNGHVEEMYGGHKIVKAFGLESESLKTFQGLNDRLAEEGWKSQFLAGLIFPAIGFVSNIGYVLICVVGGFLVAKKSVEIGDIQAFIQYMRQFSHPIIQVANIANILQSTIAAAERVFEVLDEAEELPDPVTPSTLSEPRGEVAFEGVGFRYKDAEPLIEDLNLVARAGQTIAIVGPTGAGKTTLVNLLMRFYELREGRITVDGVDIRALNRSELRQIFGMVLQDTWLFNGTIRENIAYGRLNATEEDIQRAAKTAHADHFIKTLPDGYNTVLNEEASNISQGQKQLLTIARAFLADPSILILDEATSNVDTWTEALIQKAMQSLMRGRTSFVIAHRLSTIRDADLILVLNHGKIVEQGTHTELLSRDGFYAELYNSQFVTQTLKAAEPVEA